MMALRLAWRNIWRNRRRSLIVMASIALGVAALAFTDALSRGFLRQMFDTQLGAHTGHLQVHAAGFHDNRVVTNFMRRPDSVLAAVRADPAVLRAAVRVIAAGMVSSASASSGVAIVGVDPADEAGITIIARSVREGTYLTGKEREIVISMRLAEALDVRIGGKVVAMAAVQDGSVGSELFRVAGLYRSPSAEFDRAYVYVLRRDAQRLLGVGEAAAEVVALARVPQEAPALRDRLAPALGSAYEALSYQDLLPSLVSQLEMSENSLIIFYVIIGLALIFGIINAMLMSVMERIHEFGVVKAVGMEDRRLFAMIVLEALLLGLMGCAAGMLAGAAVNEPLARTGINFATFAEGLESWGVGARVYPIVDYGSILEGVGVILAVCVAGALYPALKAVRLRPIAAIRYV